jgi:hypothetical protein
MLFRCLELGDLHHITQTDGRIDTLYSSETLSSGVATLPLIKKECLAGKLAHEIIKKA